jgi:hypothetical protein
MNPAAVFWLSIPTFFRLRRPNGVPQSSSVRIARSAKKTLLVSGGSAFYNPVITALETAAAFFARFPGTQWPQKPVALSAS